MTRESKPLMTCGHAANGVDMLGRPVCVICNNETVRAGVKLERRIARCLYGCGAITQSSVNLPFYEHRFGEEFDYYYDGCRGWE